MNPYIHTHIHKVSLIWTLCRLSSYLCVAFHLQLCAWQINNCNINSDLTAIIIVEPLNLAYHLYGYLNMMCCSLIGYPGGSCMCHFKVWCKMIRKYKGHFRDCIGIAINCNLSWYQCVLSLDWHGIIQHIYTKKKERRNEKKQDFKNNNFKLNPKSTETNTFKYISKTVKDEQKEEEDYYPSSLQYKSDSLYQMSLLP